MCRQSVTTPVAVREIVVTLATTYGAARKGLAVDPVVALRHE